MSLEKIPMLTPFGPRVRACGIATSERVDRSVGTAVTARSWHHAQQHVVATLEPVTSTIPGREMKAHEEKKDLTGKDKSQGDLVDGGAQETPEGLKRDRKGPLDKDVGRKDDAGQ
jgi:hypothetical protein